MNVQAIRIRLIEKDLRIKDLAHLARIDYERLQKVLNGYRSPRPDEIRAIAAVLKLPTNTIAGE